VETESRRLVRLILSAFVAGVIAAGGVILGSVTAEGGVKPGTWLISGVMGLTALCKDIQSTLSSPPHPQMPAPPLVNPQGQPLPPTGG
jgi:hypothetical protein